MTTFPRQMTINRLRPALHKTLALSGLLMTLFSASVLADDFSDVSKMMRTGQSAEALSRADAALEKNPRDPQMRFLKGVILAEQGKSPEAISIFIKLTEDYPGLPEPFNNLAVLYAASGQYEKARAALDSAIRTNPSYATAYENLGDVHAKLASQAYDKALQIDSGNATAKSKLTLVRSLVGNLNGNTKGALAAPGQPVPAPAPTIVARAPDPAPKPAASAPAIATPAPAPAASPPRPVEKAAAKPEPEKPATKSDANKDAARKDEAMAVKMVEDWADAWGRQDVKAYLGYYSADFQIPGGRKRKDWEEERHSRIANKGRIEVRIEDASTSIKGNMATVSFRQIYVSDRLTARTRKTLTLTRQGGKWKIRQESTGG